MDTQHLRNNLKNIFEIIRIDNIEKYYIDEDGNKQIQLMCLCAKHHNQVHPEKFKDKKDKNSKVVDERFKERW